MMNAAPPLSVTATPLAPKPPLSALQLLRGMRRDSLAFLLEMSREYGHVVRFPLGPVSACLVTHPDGIRRVLQENARNYTKQTRGFDVARELLGNGLLTSEGEFWLRQRRLAQPAFHKQRLAGFASTMIEGAEQMREEWSARARAGESMELTADLMRLTLGIASKTLFSVDVTSDAEAIARSLDVALVWANDRITRPLKVPRWIPTPANLQVRQAERTLDGVVRRIIARRRGEASKPDLLSMLMDAVDEETGESMSDDQLRDEVLTLLLAGHETTANALAWTFLLLSRHPNVRRKLEDELDEVLGGRSPGLDDLPKLVYTRMVLDESMRLYPPAWIFSRSPIADDEIGGYRIPAGTMVIMSPWATHRDGRIWENPEGFDPERFHPDRAKTIPRFAWFPFGGGPRQCIGMHFAQMELVLVLAIVAQRLRLDLVPGHPVVPQPTITLRPRYGLMVQPRLR